MRVQDVRIGETYQVKVPQRIPPALRRRPVRTPGDFYADLRLYRLRGDRFELTVTAVDPGASTVDGYEATTTTRVSVQLTDDQAALLDLPAGTTYKIAGFVSLADEEYGDDIAFPVTLPYTGLPAAWLRPLAEPVPIAPTTARFYRARIRTEAAGMTAAEVARAIDKALEYQRETAGRALDSYRAEEWLRIAESEYREWRRIGALMLEKAMETYDPESDPDNADQGS